MSTFVRTTGGFVLLGLLLATASPRAQAPQQASMDRDLMEVTVPRLQQLYRDHKYTVTQVVTWYIGPDPSVQRGVWRD